MNEILFSLVSEAVTKAEKIQLRHVTADEKNIQVWKERHPWLVVLRMDGDLRLKCSVCTKFKVNSIWSQL